MIILAHRGCWSGPSDHNTLTACERALAAGFGLEIDIRDHAGALVLSHDMAAAQAQSFDTFLQLYSKICRDLPLALNVKADGLSGCLQELLVRYSISNYFVFDMSVPETLKYRRAGVKFFTRQSEYERESLFYEEASGVWMDEFHSHWITEAVIAQHLKNNKRICVVSPELHGREFRVEWEEYRKIEQQLGRNDLMLCTDRPEEARRFFND